MYMRMYTSARVKVPTLKTIYSYFMLMYVHTKEKKKNEITTKGGQPF